MKVFLIGIYMLSKLFKNKKLVLASQSPRRLEIFQNAGLNPLQIPAKIVEEKVDLPPYKFVQYQAKLKAKTIASQLDNSCVVVASDTIVFNDNLILGKPQSKYQAYEYLRELSGKTHIVYTGVAIIYSKRVVTFYEKTSVTFDDLTDNEIEAYIETGDCMDKAGAYGIQGISCQFIKKSMVVTSM